MMRSMGVLLILGETLCCWLMRSNGEEEVQMWLMLPALVKVVGEKD